MTARRIPVIPVNTPEIGIDQLAAAVRGGAAIVDVREPGEYVAGHVPGAVLIPMGQLPGRMAELYHGAPCRWYALPATAAPP
jgi:rhodanese-related sulfurtransferase